LGLKDDTLWEVQWHPANGGAFRRIVMTRRGLRRVVIVLGLLVVLTLGIVGVLPLGLKGFLGRFTIAAARRENLALRDRSDLLREHAFAAAEQLYGRLQRARRFAWMVGESASAWQERCEAPPPPNARDEAVIGWLATVGSRLDQLAAELASPSSTPPCPLANLPSAAPVDRSQVVPVALFGWRTSPFTGKRMAQHGATLAAHLGEAVVAPGAGTVLFAGSVRERRANEWTRFGNVVVIDHGGGVLTVFGHLQDVAVRRGQALARAQRIGTVGQTGWTRVPALYFEIRWPVGGVSKPIDPALVNLALPVEELDARMVAPAADLPDDFAPLPHLVGGGGREPARPRRTR
jgi:murein DD-endopeptidase MepM/ murein hydrolase activator NlpD